MRRLSVPSRNPVMGVLRTAEAPASATGPDLDRALTALAGIIGLGVMVSALLVLAGWAIDIPVLKSLSSDMVTMKPNAAAGLVLGGLSLCLSLQWTAARPWPWRVWPARALAALVGMLGLLTLGQYGWGWDLGIDQILFAESADAIATVTAGRMSLLTAVNFSALAAALLLLDVETRAGLRPSNWLALAIAANCYLVLVDYLYDARGMYGIALFTPVALPTAILFLALSLGLVCARPGARFMRQIGGDSAAGRASRRLLPAAILVPPIVGWLLWQGELAGLYPTAFGLALFTASCAAIFIALIWRHARHLERESSAREQAEQALCTAHDTLHQQVEERTALLQESNSQLVTKGSLINAIYQAQSQFIAGAVARTVFDDLLASFLRFTGSAYGFIDELGQGPDGQPRLTALALTDVSWNEPSRDMYAQFLAGTLHLSKRESLFGAVMITGKPVIANDAANDPRRGGVPPDHPPLAAFLGLPLFCSGQLVGVVGLANRAGGYSKEIIAELEPLTQCCANLLFAWRSERERLATQAALDRQSAQLEAANKELETFSYSVAHDLRTPLRAIDGFTQVLVEDYADKLDENGRDSLQRVRDAAQRMASMVDDLLALSQVARSEPHLDKVDLSALAQSAVAELREAMPEREVAVSIAPGISARGDRRLLATVMTCLLSNAWKFTGKQPAAVIEFNAERQAGELRCHVRDNGAGFDMAAADRLFGPFQRLHKASEFPGTGIGLATTKRIIARHGGQVWAEGMVGQGATFSFSLPDGEEGA